MRVRELIEKLKEFGDGNHVVFDGDDGECWTVGDIDVDADDLFVVLKRGEKLSVVEDDQYADCDDCEYNDDEHRTVRVQCDDCKEQVKKLVDHLVAAKVERSSMPRGDA